VIVVEKDRITSGPKQIWVLEEVYLDTEHGISEEIRTE
jgi:hypothetical protein